MPLAELFPDAISYAFAGLYYPNIGDAARYDISDYLCIVPRTDELDIIYLPRTKGFNPPDHYLVGHSNEDRKYTYGRRELKDMKDSLSSLLIAHQSLCVYHSCHYFIGPILSYGIDSRRSIYSLFQPPTPAFDHEIDHPTRQTDGNPFIKLYRTPLDDKFPKFFYEVAKTYYPIQNLSWTLAAHKFAAAMISRSLVDIVLDLAITLEALIIRGDENVSYKARLHTALLVGQSYRERQKIEKDIKAFYNTRSKIIHGDNVEFNENTIEIIKRTGEYLARALRLTCGCSKKDVEKEIDYLSLLGTPSYIRERSKLIINWQDIDEYIAAYIKRQYCGKEYRIGWAAPEEDGECELMVEIVAGEEIIDSIELDFIMHSMPQVRAFTEKGGYYRYIYSDSDEGKYSIIITYIKE